MEIKILENLFPVTIERGNLWKRQDQIIYNRIMVNFGLLNSGKVELRSTIDQGRNLRISLEILQKVDPHRKESLLDGNAQSARYGDLIHDRTEKLASVHYQEEANSENFVMGSDEVEFVNKVND